jgi:hypothetical protein
MLGSFNHYENCRYSTLNRLYISYVGKMHGTAHKQRTVSSFQYRQEILNVTNCYEIFTCDKKNQSTNNYNTTPTSLKRDRILAISVICRRLFRYSAFAVTMETDVRPTTTTFHLRRAQCTRAFAKVGNATPT